MPLYDAHNRPLIEASSSPLSDPIDGYENRMRLDAAPELRAALLAESERWQRGERIDGDGRTVRLDAANVGAIDFDGFANELTGIGTWSGDKTKGGRIGGVRFELTRMGGIDAEMRWRGSDLGGNIVEKTADEMTREGWDMQVQPTEEEQQQASDPRAAMDAAMRAPRRAAAGWRQLAKRSASARCLANARRWDDFALGLGDPEAGAPPPPPGALPHLNDEGIELGEAMDRTTDELSMLQAFNQALKYERAFGGAAILIGADDGQNDLTQPLDEKNIKSIRHLTPFFGGWDGELVAWSYYNDPRKPKYGQPMIYMLRNLGVPLARPPAPGETNPQPYTLPQGPAGPLIFYIHESRLLVFDGSPSSRRAQVEMRGWGDSVFTRCDEVLSQFEQSWNGIAVLMQEYSIAIVKQKGLTELLLKAKNNSDVTSSNNAVLTRARQLALSQSICKTRLLDADEEFSRETVSVAGVADVMEQFALRLAAAADMPVSMIFGQVKGGLGDAGNTDLRFFYDRIASKQRRRLLPLLKRLYRLLWLAKDSPTRGRLPERWDVRLRPLWQMTAKEKADLRLVVTQADEIGINTQQVTPEEVSATRNGGPEFNDGPIVLDLEAREALAAYRIAPPSDTSTPPAPALPGAPQAAATAPAGGATLELTPTMQGAIVKVNQALAHISLPPLTLPDGTRDPDGEMTIAEYLAKHSAVVAAGSNAEEGLPPNPETEAEVAAEVPGAPVSATAKKPDKPAAAAPATTAAVVARPKGRAAPPAATAKKPDAPAAPASAAGPPKGITPEKKIPPMTATPGDPITGDPVGTPSTTGNTADNPPKK